MRMSLNKQQHQLAQLWYESIEHRLKLEVWMLHDLSSPGIQRNTE